MPLYILGSSLFGAQLAGTLGLPYAFASHFAPDSLRGNAICHMVDASEVANVAVSLASEKAWAISGELVAASGGAGRSVYY